MIVFLNKKMLNITQLQRTGYFFILQRKYPTMLMCFNDDFIAFDKTNVFIDNNVNQRNMYF